MAPIEGECLTQTQFGESLFDQLSQHECGPSEVIFVDGKVIFAHGPHLILYRETSSTSHC